MNKSVFLLLCIVMYLSIIPVSAQKFVPNYDESKIPAYTLPDPLIFENGSKVRTEKEWEKRREEILRIFESEVYGISPAWKGKIIPALLSSEANALDGTAVRREIRLTLKNGSKELPLVMLLYLPKTSERSPVFLGYNFNGNHTVTDEPGISVTGSWIRNNVSTGAAGNRASEAGRGKEASRWQVKEIISRGYGLATIYYGDADPDFDDGFKNGVHGLYDQQPDDSSWGTIAAWAWGLSRAMDYLETVAEVDPGRVIVMGHSRLGKTALWAGATDKRFAVVISNNSGCGGAALSKRVYGETVGSINESFPHWFCENFNKYNLKEELLPVDQHQLLALIAPRPVYVASAEEDQWADPKGEFLSCVKASPVYVLLGKKGFPDTGMPPVNTPVVGSIGYHIRTGGHDVTLYDWKQYLDFADLHLKRK
ncbi:MAG: acetylxylan esterase [Bacteroidales bacterium]|nr:acetylxylan esterase [Bacteroidales bacterium]